MSKTDTRKPTIVGVPMTDAMRDQLKELARKHRWSMASTARYMIELGLERQASETESAGEAA